MAVGVQLADSSQGNRDERSDYSKALDRYYGAGPVQNWSDSFISAYASMHPLEDWAETWLHYLHIHDALETAVAGGIAKTEVDFGRCLDLWMELSVTLNEFNRSLGLEDYYPFVISATVWKKLEFVHRRLCLLVGAPRVEAALRNQ